MGLGGGRFLISEVPLWGLCLKNRIPIRKHWFKGPGSGIESEVLGEKFGCWVENLRFWIV